MSVDNNPEHTVPKFRNRPQEYLNRRVIRVRQP